jgi:hypothetical protein
MSQDAAPRWSLATRIAFRFAFSYLTLALFLDMAFGLIPGGEIAARGYFEFWDAVVVRVGEDFLDLPYEIDFESRGIGNTPYGWTLCLCYLVLAAVATVVWSVLDRNRDRYDRLYAWLRLGLRFVLAAAMIRYGVIKAIPSQMTAPPPMGLLARPIGDLVPNHLLWWTIGASPPFETLIGLAELLGGLLLLVPRTVLLGALLCAANSLTIFVLNMCYDVPVKLYSLHLFVMAAVLIAPDLRRLADVFLFNRRAEPARPASLTGRKWPDRALHALVVVGALYTIVPFYGFAMARYRMMHPPRPPHYGYWSVETFEVDGRGVPMFTDPDRWRWASFLNPGTLGVELMIGSQKAYPLEGLHLIPQEKGVLILEGELDGHRVRARLRRMPLIRDVPWPYRP